MRAFFITDVLFLLCVVVCLLLRPAVHTLCVCCPCVAQRSDNSFILIVGAAFLLPALVILAVAQGSGYLDALYSNTMR